MNPPPPPPSSPDPRPATPQRDGIYLFSAAACHDATRAHADRIHPRASHLLVELTGVRPWRGCTVARSARLLDLGEQARARAAADPAVQPLHLGHAVLIPGLVNAHAHLDLTHVGPVPFDPDAGFAGWAARVGPARRTDPDQIRQSVLLGIELSLAGGVVAVGDIAGATGRIRPEPLQALASSPLSGVSFLEYFPIGTRESFWRQEVLQALADLRDASPGPARPGLQPHATYSASPDSLRWTLEHAAAAGWPVATHLAENPDERQFIAHARGPIADFYRAIRLWGPDTARDLGLGRSPIEHWAHALRGMECPTGLIAAHVNDAPDPDLHTLARIAGPLRLTVAYCPRSSEYFLNHAAFGPHRYRDMLAAGVRVALGTDSVLNLPPGPAEPGLPSQRRISTLDEMRLLRRRDRADPATLLAMGTTHGAAALGLDPDLFTFRRGGELAGLVAVPLPAGATPDLASALETDSHPRLLFCRNPSC